MYPSERAPSYLSPRNGFCRSCLNFIDSSSYLACPLKFRVFVDSAFVKTLQQ